VRFPFSFPVKPVALHLNFRSFEVFRCLLNACGRGFISDKVHPAEFLFVVCSLLCPFRFIVQLSRMTARPSASAVRRRSAAFISALTARGTSVHGTHSPAEITIGDCCVFWVTTLSLSSMLYLVQKHFFPSIYLSSVTIIFSCVPLISYTFRLSLCVSVSRCSSAHGHIASHAAHACMGGGTGVAGYRELYCYTCNRVLGTVLKS